MSRLFIDAARTMSVGIEIGTTWRAFDAIGRHDQVLLDRYDRFASNWTVGGQLSNVSSLTVRKFTGLRSLCRIHALDLVCPLQVLPIDQLSLLAAASGKEVSRRDLRCSDG